MFRVKVLAGAAAFTIASAAWSDAAPPPPLIQNNAASPADQSNLDCLETLDTFDPRPNANRLKLSPGCEKRKAEIEAAASRPPPTAEELLAKVEDLNWAEYFLLASMLEQRGDLNQAGQWFYVGQIRGRAQLICEHGADPSGAPALLASLNATVGPDVNGGLGANPDNWIEVVRSALAWEEAHPDAALVTAKCRPGLDFARKDKLEMIAYIARHKDELRAGSKR